MIMIKKIDSKLISVNNNGVAVIAADQQWFRTLFHSISGCGPTTASVILMYMASVFPDQCRGAYPYELPAKKEDFVPFMEAVREYVKPGLHGLTDDGFFAEQTAAFAKKLGVPLAYNRVMSSLTVGVAYGYIKKAVDEGYLPALLILRNPARELDDFTWHWMVITGYDDEKRTVFIATNGSESELSFDLIWHQKNPYKSACVYFYPE
jgi:hypothetical protein